MGNRGVPKGPAWHYADAGINNRVERETGDLSDANHSVDAQTVCMRTPPAIGSHGTSGHLSRPCRR